MERLPVAFGVGRRSKGHSWDFVDGADGKAGALLVADGAVWRMTPSVTAVSAG